MKTRLVIDGNAFYEIDEECMERKRISKREGEERIKEGRRQTKNTADMGTEDPGNAAVL